MNNRFCVQVFLNEIITKKDFEILEKNISSFFNDNKLKVLEINDDADFNNADIVFLVYIKDWGNDVKFQWSTEFIKPYCLCYWFFDKEKAAEFKILFG